MPATRIVLVALVFSIAGCGARGPSRMTSAGGGGGGGSTGPDVSAPVIAFPTVAEIQHLVATAPPPALVADDSVRPTEWALGPAELTESGPADSIAAAVAEGRDATTSAPARCAARELAHFVAVHGGVPDLRTRLDMAAFCGMATTGVALAARPFRGRGHSDAELVEEVGAGLAADLTRGLGDTTSAVDIGAAVFQEDGVGAVAAFAGLSAVRLDGGNPAPAADGTVSFSGMRLTAGSVLAAITNVGPYGAAVCTVSTEASRFLVTCPSDPADALARIDLVATEHDGVLLMPVGSIFAMRDRAATLEVGVGTVSPTPVSAETFAVTVAPILDARRAAAGLSPLTHAVLQSATNRELVPFVLNGDRDARALASLAAIAGYSVDGLIRQGRMTIAAEVGTNDATRWLDRVLALPVGRWSLLAPEARSVAFGAVVDGTSLAALATTYAFFEASPGADADHVMDLITSARGARSLAPATRVMDLPGMDEALGRLGRGERTLAGALDDVMRAISATGHSVRGWVVATSDLDITPFADEVVAAWDPPRVGIGVVAYRAEGGAWGQYGVLVVQIVD